MLVLLATFAFTAAADQRQTAFKAYAKIPRAAALRLAKVASCEGAPEPERWHFIVQEPQAENGFRDYVIVNGQVAATNDVSQFADEVRAEDVLALNSVRIDSDYVAQVAIQYAAANSVGIASLNYELHKESAGAPVWKVTCLDPSRRTVGWLVVDAGNGKVIRQSGFEIAPVVRYNVSGEPTAGDQLIVPPAGGFHPPSPPPVASREPVLDDEEISEPTGGFRRTQPPDQTYRNVRPPTSRSREVEVRRAEPVTRQPPPQRRRFEIDLFRPGRRLFPFGDD